MKSFGSRATGARLERMRASPRWAGEGFRNVHPSLPGLRDPAAPRPTLTDFLCGEGRRVPGAPLPALDPLDRWRRAPQSGLRATWLGHSTVLVEIGGARLLTDPVWGRRASPSRLVGPKRFQPVPVPVPVRALPPLSAVLLSHDHYDHLDLHTVRELVKHQPQVPWVTSLGVGAHLEAFGVAPGCITELDWWERWPVPGHDVVVHAAPSQHFSGRSLSDRNATAWSSFVVESARQRVFFSGDTGLTTEYAAVRERFGRFDLVMLEAGAFHPSWGDIHLGPGNALKAHALLGSGALMPIHWGTFALAMHDWDEPAEVLFEQAPKAGARLVMPKLGEAFEPAHAPEPQPWWRDGTVRAPAPPAPPEPLPKQPLPWPLD
jgi:L-ascorbate metabolism protein UlaG (beta-lactamase superfamily)